MTDKQDTTAGEARKTWQERNAEARTKEAKAELVVEWQAADEQILKVLGGSGKTRALELATKALERWSRESRGIPARQYAIWVRDADVAQPVTTSEHHVGRASNESDTPEAQLEARELAASLAENEPCHDLGTLKRLTLAVCRRKFCDIAECEWADLPEWVTTEIKGWSDEDPKIERQAEAALKLLRSALLALRALPNGGGAVRANWARHMARELRSADIEAVVEFDPDDPRLDVDERGLGMPNLRQKLAAFWTLAAPYVREKRTPEIESWAGPAELAQPLASGDDLAVVAILAGDWPGAKWKPDWQKGVSPSDVIASIKSGFDAKQGSRVSAAVVMQSRISYLSTPKEKKI